MNAYIHIKAIDSQQLVHLGWMMYGSFAGTSEPRNAQKVILESNLFLWFPMSWSWHYCDILALHLYIHTCIYTYLFKPQVSKIITHLTSMEFKDAVYHESLLTIFCMLLLRLVELSLVHCYQQCWTVHCIYV